MTTKTHAKTRTLVEGALMIALGTVLSYIPIYELPHGGSVTFVSMLPIILMSLRHGPKWGLFTAFVHSLIQLFLGIKNLTYCQTLGAQVGCVLLDYVLAFTALGLAWYVAKPFPAARAGRAAGAGTAALVVCVLRYVCSVLSGYVVWKDYDYAFEWMTNFGWGQAIAGMGENALCWLYSVVYNATYMIPETLVTVGAAVVLALAAPKLFDSRAKL
ncbi:MAG: energy-coupled thiamine transporter ThiT [Oscillospiraceae bacterium]|nr:MAG: energy-coupled thiamine transporter ThiT [Oscillospiraceae bacterium]